MAEPDDFGNSGGPTTIALNKTLVNWEYLFATLPAGAKLDLKLTVGGQSATKTLTVPANKTAHNISIVITGVLT